MRILIHKKSMQKLFPQIPILMFFIILIISINIRELDKYQIDQLANNNDQITIDYILLHQVVDQRTLCHATSGIFDFYIPHCTRYKVGDDLLVTGRVRQDTVKQEYGQKRLSIQSIVQIRPDKVSGNYVISSFLHIIDVYEASIRAALAGILVEPYSSISEGIMFGSFTHFPTSIIANLKTVGMQSLFSLSAYKATIVAEFAERFIKKFMEKSTWKKPKISIPFVILFIYLVISGFTLSLLRMVLLVIGSWLAQHIFYRQFSKIYSFCIITVLLLCCFPFSLLDIGFQLSTTATLGVLLFSPLFLSLKKMMGVRKSAKNAGKNTAVPQNNNIQKRGRMFFKERFIHFLICIANVVYENFVLVVCFQLLSFPLLVYYFGSVTLCSFLFQCLFLWTMPLLVVLVIITAHLAVILPLFFATLFAALLTFIEASYLQLIVSSIQFFGSLPTLQLHFELWQVAMWWVVVLAFSFIIKRFFYTPKANSNIHVCDNF